MNAGRAPRAVLLDTCAVIWFFGGEPLQGDAQDAIVQAVQADGVFISPISAWEIGLLSRPRVGRTFQFLPDPMRWFARIMAQPGVMPAAFTPEIAIGASHLPEPLHGDPADRLLIATARAMAMPVVTRDSKILAYGAAGHVAALLC